MKISIKNFMKKYKFYSYLPLEIEWMGIDRISPNSYKEILIAAHKHSDTDWFITMGWVEPIDNYTDFKIMCKMAGLSSHYPDFEILKSDILAIGIFRSYGNVYESN